MYTKTNTKIIMITKYIKYSAVPMMCICIFFMTTNVFADSPGDSTTGSGSNKFENPVQYGTVNDLLTGVMTAVQGIVAALAVLMIVVGGILYITSAGDQGRVQLAKSAVTAAIIGLALALAAPAFLKEIYDVLGASGGPSVTKDLSTIIIDTIKTLSGFVGALSVLMLVVGGVMYMVSAGDSSRVETARKIIQYSIIGLVVALLALIIVTQVIGVF